MYLPCKFPLLSLNASSSDWVCGFLLNWENLVWKSTATPPKVRGYGFGGNIQYLPCTFGHGFWDFWKKNGQTVMISSVFVLRLCLIDVPGLNCLNCSSKGEGGILRSAVSLRTPWAMASYNISAHSKYWVLNLKMIFTRFANSWFILKFKMVFTSTPTSKMSPNFHRSDEILSKRIFV